MTNKCQVCHIEYNPHADRCGNCYTRKDGVRWKLLTKTFAGNIHEVAISINRSGSAEYVLSLTMVGGYTIVVFKMPAKLVHDLRRLDPSFTLDPKFDDTEE